MTRGSGLPGRDEAGQPAGDAEAAVIARAADAAIEDAVQRIARQAGAGVTEEAEWPGSAIMDRRADAAAGLRIAHGLELAARRRLLGYIRVARQGCMSWHEIGALLAIGPDAAERGLTVAEAAFGFAVGPAAWGEAPAFAWTCRACGQMISDRGPVTGGHPDDEEPGHADRCARLAVAVAEHDAVWTQDS